MMDYQKKKDDVLAVWQDLFDVCKKMVKQAKAGKEKINASLLKECNAFLRMSLQMMQDGIDEEEERRRNEEAQILDDDLPDFDDSPEDLGGDGNVSPMVKRLKTDVLEF